MAPKTEPATSKSPPAKANRGKSRKPRPDGSPATGKPALGKPATGKPALDKPASSAPSSKSRSSKSRSSKSRSSKSRSTKSGATTSGAASRAALGAVATSPAPGPGTTRNREASQPAAGLARLPKGKAAGPQPWTAAEIAEAFRRLRAANPEPRGELHYLNPFTLLVAVVLSAQATDAGVNKATPALFAAADTPEKMVALGEDKVREIIRTIGLFRTKARNLVALSQRLVAEHGGMVPPIRDELEKLPGVGRKTASVVLNIAFGEETIAVDTHIFRVGNRTGMAPGKNPLEVETALENGVPQPYRRHAHHWLILHGRYVCKAQRPLCGKCPINDLCRWPQKAAFAGG
jgi:endonuclease III